MNVIKWKTLKNIAALSAAVSIGWFCAEKKNKILLNEDISKILTHENPIFGSVFASGIDNSVVPSSDFSPQASPNASRISQIMKFGFPSYTNVRSLDDYVLAYDQRNRIPYWVLEHLTKENVKKNSVVDRSKSNFQEDSSFHPFFRAVKSDYKHSGFDRGHMAAAGNHRRSQRECDQTFLLSNMAPQVGKGFNRGKWNDLERYCRDLTFKFDHVYVSTGPLFLPRQEGDGLLYVRYRVLGKNHVAVPTHFFKAILCENANGKLYLEVLILPNSAIDDSVPLKTFQVNLEVLERASGLLFFSGAQKGQLATVNGRAFA